MPPPRNGLLVGLVASLVAGIGAGLVDGLWSWSASSQFVPDLPGKLRLLLYLAAACGLAAAVIGTAVTAIGIGLVRWTRIGDLLRRAGEVPARTWLSLELFIPLAALALVVAGELAEDRLGARRHFGLVIAVVIAATVGALLVAALVSFAIGALIERALGASTIPRAAPGWVAIGLVVVSGALVGHRYRETLSLLPLRGPAVAAVTFAFAIGFAPAARRLVDRIGARPLWQAAAGAAGLGLFLVIATIAAGARDGVIKSAVAYSGLGGPVARGLRPLGDLDRDGFSRVLGGGDCDDGDPSINPRAEEIPDDGIDQNCVEGDASTRPWRTSVDEVGFAEVPASAQGLNVLLITIDTLRADHLGAYGYRRDTSPALDALAAQGTLFVNGWAHAPSTRYSMPAGKRNPELSRTPWSSG